MRGVLSTTLFIKTRCARNLASITRAIKKTDFPLFDLGFKDKMTNISKILMNNKQLSLKLNGLKIAN